MRCMVSFNYAPPILGGHSLHLPASLVVSEGYANKTKAKIQGPLQSGSPLTLPMARDVWQPRL
jgi:hypothetical protein